jgi:DNA-binding HxlR family transcriptional regulator
MAAQLIHEIKGMKCPYEQSIELIGDRSILLIVKELHLKRKPLRFNELLLALGPLSSKTLSAKLKDLMRFEIIRKDIISTTPLVATYRLTEKGKGLIKILDMMARWSAQWHAKGR